jgi:L-malate glycosyltransferase
MFPGGLTVKSSLRVALLTPTALPNITGNAITVERWRRALEQLGVETKVIEIRDRKPRRLIKCLSAFCPDIVHAHHASRAGLLMMDPFLNRVYGSLPLVISLAGTDIHPAAPGDKGIILDACKKARCIISQNHEMTERLNEISPALKSRVRYVAKAFAWLGDDKYDLRAVADCAADDVLFFMPAGIRPVKGNLECLAALESVHAAGANVKAVFAGPALERTYADRFKKEIERLQFFARWIPQISPTAMRSAYLSADLVLNNSSVEGLSNSLLEAMAAGRAVLASDIPGNRWIVRDETGAGSCGELFEPGNAADFFEKALQLANEPARRESLASAGKMRASVLPGASQEAQAILEIYRSVLAGV